MKGMIETPGEDDAELWVWKSCVWTPLAGAASYSGSKNMWIGDVDGGCRLLAVFRMFC
jgi:hypothetical protein